MQPGVLRISETVTTEIEAIQAIILLNVASEKIIFGNAAIVASEDLKSVIDKIKQISEAIEVETDSIYLQTNSGMFGKSSTADYRVKIKVNDLSLLGAILGICAEAKKIEIQSLSWEYDEASEKLALIRQAVQKAKQKADQMMEVIGYQVVGIRSCSDSYHLPQMDQVIFSEAQSAPETAMLRSRKAQNINFGTPFKSKKQISATCTAEFLVQPLE